MKRWLQWGLVVAGSAAAAACAYAALHLWDLPPPLRNTLFLGLPVLAILPSVMPRWKLLAFAMAVFLAVGWYVLAEISKDLASGDDSPGVFGLGFYLVFVGVLFVGSCILRVVVTIVGWLFKITEPKASNAPENRRVYQTGRQPGIGNRRAQQ